MKDKITKIKCSQENIQGKTFQLTLVANNAKADNNGLYKFYLEHKPISKTALMPGMNVSVSVSYKARENDILSIPLNALFEDQGSSYVWIVNDSIVNKQLVETCNIVRDGEIGIISGLKENQQVVVGGLNLLKENETVKVIPPKSETNVGNLL
jgi:hypothetical protein